jgi:hypothetical protein
MYAHYFNGLEQAGVADGYRSVGHTLLLAMDGTAYFSSPTITVRRAATPTAG